MIDFGNVTNSGTGSVSNQSQMNIEWDAVMIDNDKTLNGTFYWVSAGAEYSRQNEIWIGQAGFTTIQDNYVSLRVLKEYLCSRDRDTTSRRRSV